jgi:hypothetical protein
MASFLIQFLKQRIEALESQRNTAPKPGLFLSPNDAALRWYRAMIQTRINELWWILRLINPTTTTSKP